MGKHTPGPWFVESGSIRVLSDDARATIVCDVTGSPSNPQAVADANLIAASPDLLQLVQAIVKGRGLCFIPTDDPSRHTFNWDELAASAIAKATGERE